MEPIRSATGCRAPAQPDSTTSESGRAVMRGIIVDPTRPIRNGPGSALPSAMTELREEHMPVEVHTASTPVLPAEWPVVAIAIDRDATVRQPDQPDLPPS